MPRMENQIDSCKGIYDQESTDSFDEGTRARASGKSPGNLRRNLRSVPNGSNNHHPASNDCTR
jgi:hypothetical protein